MLEWTVRAYIGESYSPDEEWMWVVRTQNYVDTLEAVQDALVSVAQCIRANEGQERVTLADVALTNWEHTYWMQCGILDIFRLLADVSLEYDTDLTKEEIEWLAW